MENNLLPWPTVGQISKSIPVHASNVKCEVQNVLKHASTSDVAPGGRNISYGVFEALSRSVLALIDKVLDQSDKGSFEGIIQQIDETSQKILSRLESSTPVKRGFIKAGGGGVDVGSCCVGVWHSH
jgi:hypothetical protein